jgi:hypothetical protein
MEELGLDVGAYAKALIHWEAKVDTKEVKFQLAASQSSYTSATFELELFGEHTMCI